MPFPLTGRRSLLALIGALIGWVGGPPPARAELLALGWAETGAAGGTGAEGRGRGCPVTAYRPRDEHPAEPEAPAVEEETLSDEEMERLDGQAALAVLMVIPPIDLWMPPPASVLPPPPQPETTPPPGPPPDITPPPAPKVPEPAALLTGLLGSCLAGLAAIKKRRGRKAAPEADGMRDRPAVAAD